MIIYPIQKVQGHHLQPGTDTGRHPAAGKHLPRILICLVLALTVLLGGSVMAQETYESTNTYSADQLGSINVHLISTEENAVALPDYAGVGLFLYKVGSANPAAGSPAFVFDEAYASASSLYESGNITSTIKVLTDLIGASTTLSENHLSGTTDANGYYKFEELPQGLYLLVEDTSIENDVSFTPALYSVPGIVQDENGVSLVYDQTVNPKPQVIPSGEEQTGSITVTKYVRAREGDSTSPYLYVEDYSTWIGLYRDPEGTNLIPGLIKELKINYGQSGEVTFDDLPADVYYVFECNKDGESYKSKNNTDAYGVSFDVIYDKQKITLDLTSNSAKSAACDVTNIYSDVPEGMTVYGEIKIKKNVYDYENKLINLPNEEFWAIVYRVDTDENGKEKETYYTEKQLEQNGTVTVDAPLGGESGTEDVTYKIYEGYKNSEGKVVKAKSGNAFKYIFHISNDGKVELKYTDNQSPEGSLFIDNIQFSPTPTITPPVEDGEEPTPAVYITRIPPNITYVPGSSTIYTNNVPGSSVTYNTVTQSQTPANPVKTADDTPIALYIMLLAAAAVVTGFVLVRKKQG